MTIPRSVLEGDEDTFPLPLLDTAVIDKLMEELMKDQPLFTPFVNDQPTADPAMPPFISASQGKFYFLIINFFNS